MVVDAVEAGKAVLAIEAGEVVVAIEAVEGAEAAMPTRPSRPVMSRSSTPKTFVKVSRKCDGRYVDAIKGIEAFKEG